MSDDEPHIEGVGPWQADGREWACWCHLCRAMREAWPETTRMWNPASRPESDSDRPFTEQEK